ncbi:sodium:solute symporter family protein [Cardinium endosymbiont of Nabis limbatus]|uniref:sodium:solute symporter family protein n=1 Tax=Cardinium endosymbiont of Nabis limbatus TaxID=3066217 RepID=UPI003AF40961
MVPYNVSLLMVWAFLGLTLAIGLCAAQKTTFRAYAVGDKRFHTNTLVVTVLATAFGGGVLMRNMPHIYDDGISCILYSFGTPLSFWIISLLGIRMDPFMNHLSIAETIGSVYGKYPRWITALLAICFSIGLVAIQINVVTSAIGMCIDSINPRMVTVWATLILISYAILGGVRAITTTDVLQFVTFIIIIALFIKFLFIKTGKSFLEVVWQLKQEEKFELSNFFQRDRNLFNVIQVYLAALFYLSPSILQRLYMASSPIQAYKVFLRATFFSVIILGCIVWIGLLVFVCHPTLSKTEIWPYILADRSPAYRGCMVICLLGMTMSTADSNLHTAATMVSHDIVGSIRNVPSNSHIHQLRWAKLTLLITGLLAMIVTAYYPDLYRLASFVISYGISLFIITVIPPFILAIFGFRGSTCTALMGMLTATLVYLVWEQWIQPKTGIGFGCFPLAANFLAMMATHYLLPQLDGKGWIGRSNQQKRMQQLIQAFKKYKKRIDLE